ncbi:MAG TPA: hypothetical protein VLM89_08930 [Phycisphaerae bacterium]|nr:hypothetical protein [Phycisphaerae bacterium]
MLTSKTSVMMAVLAAGALVVGVNAGTAQAQCYPAYGYSGYYYSPPVYVAPAPVVYAPPPIVYAPAPVWAVPVYRSYGYGGYGYHSYGRRSYYPSYRTGYCAPRPSRSFGFGFGWRH